MLNTSEGTGIFKTMEETKDWLDKMQVEKYIINPKTLIVDVAGYVNLNNENLMNIPVQFGHVEGSFYCHNNKLKTLKGTPFEVYGNFTCAQNKITTLEFAPKFVKSQFQAQENPKLISLNNTIEHVGGKLTFSMSESLKELNSHLDEYGFIEIELAELNKFSFYQKLKKDLNTQDKKPIKFKI